VATLETAHPLEPLTADEIAAAWRIVREARSLPETARCCLLLLQEPGKAEVNAHGPGALVERKALAVVLDRATGAVAEAVVSITAGRVETWTEVPPDEGQPPLLLEELFGVERIVKADPGWLAAVARRGVTTSGSGRWSPWCRTCCWP